MHNIEEQDGKECKKVRRRKMTTIGEGERTREEGTRYASVDSKLRNER